jgi:tryptophan synthase alpha chain
VTGARERLAADVPALLGRVRASSSLPIAIGFGISTPEHVADACRAADAAVVGSALVDTIARNGDGRDPALRAGEYVKWLKSRL